MCGRAKSPDKRFRGADLRRATGDVLADDAASEPQRHSLRPVIHAKLAEQPTRVCLDRVFGEKQLAADLVVRLAATHPVEYLTFTFSQRRVDGLGWRVA